MEFGSSHVYFVRSGGPIATVSGDSGASSFQQDSIALRYAYGRDMHVARWPLTKCLQLYCQYSCVSIL